MSTVVLCRMLFTRHGTNDFRPAKIGPFGAPGLTINSDWSLHPIEIVDGMPFKVLYGGGGMNGGGPESGASYLRYCMTNCDWSAFRFHEPSFAEKRNPLQKLISSSKWRRPLNTYEF